MVLQQTVRRQGLSRAVQHRGRQAVKRLQQRTQANRNAVVRGVKYGSSDCLNHDVRNNTETNYDVTAVMPTRLNAMSELWLCVVWPKKAYKTALKLSNAG
jgi:hypothetical protein